MPRLTDESKPFYAAIYSIVLQIPYGHVTNYGHIAYLCNKPANSRQVGSALKNYKIIISALNRDLEDDFISDQIPWWRVVLSSGKISARTEPSSEFIQADLLRQEGVDVSQGNMIDMEQYGWFPDEVDY